MFEAVTRSRHCGALWCVFDRMSYDKTIFPMMKMSHYNGVHWMTRLAPPRWVQKMKLTLMSMTSEFRLRSRSVHDPSHKREKIMKFQLTWGCMGRPYVLFGSLDRESLGHHIFQHSCLRELCHFHSRHYNHDSSYVTYSLSTLHMWFDHDSWSVVGRTCWDDRYDRNRVQILERYFYMEDFYLTIPSGNK